MATLKATDAEGLTKHISMSGAGTEASPFVGESRDPQITTLTGTDVGGRLALKVEARLIDPSFRLGQYKVAPGSASAGTISTTPRNLVAMSAYNHNAGVAYLQLFNLATHPTPGAVPDYLWLVPGKGNLILSSDYLAGGLGGYGVGLWFGSGISWGLSITFASYTAATAADCYVEARYY